MDDASVFDAAFNSEAADGSSQPAPEAPAEAASEAARQAPERGPDGKFLAKASEAAKPAQAAPEPSQAQERPIPPAEPKAEPGHIPIAAMLDEREKRQALERQLADYRQREAEWRSANAAPVTPEAQIQAELYAQRLEMSRGFAESRYGAEQVNQVHDWAVARCDTDPFFNEKMRASRNPYEEAMQAWHREQVAAEVSPTDLDAFRAWKAAQAQVAAAGQVQAQPTPSVASPPRSLVSHPGNGVGGAPSVPVEDGAAFAAAIT